MLRFFLHKKSCIPGECGSNDPISQKMQLATIRNEKKRCDSGPIALRRYLSTTLLNMQNERFAQLDFNVIIAKAKHVVNMRAKEFTLF